ncbi:DUF4134 domain-containing protein [Pedobacter cryophilus]|uniref:DUF4134 domain-containing protein n=1 Tax=Pedobacter cryophilus TaxID=2571271 RepID=A0A4U1C1Q8_9SPHI|nr:DUF4134 domain-containing protein [Pedobacter cryophilus]TKB99161.1 DUF4134 domain-containing protein [Pedobacter cryophilus]
MKIRIRRNFNRTKVTKTILLCSTLIIISFAVMAQDGNAGITEATNKVRSYFITGTNLMYAIGSIVGLVGAIKVFQKWNAGDEDTSKVASAWFASCVFLVIVATVLQSFFGI